MPGRNIDSKPGRLVGPILASSLVVFLGALGISATVAISGKDPGTALLIFLGCLVGTCFLAFLLGNKSVDLLSTRFGWMMSRENRKTTEYIPQAMRIKRRFGTNLPPSANEIAEAKQSLNSWVPAPNKRTSPPSKQD
ncbi:hypothetical protein [Planctomicrobium sp. SH527]|uniref:hypothetical protein n=1 Tax=Planctomicrobium sp. SH527 TaxID=3448123 RepID=UPI003F5C61A3